MKPHLISQNKLLQLSDSDVELEIIVNIFFFAENFLIVTIGTFAAMAVVKLHCKSSVNKITKFTKMDAKKETCWTSYTKQISLRFDI